MEKLINSGDFETKFSFPRQFCSICFRNLVWHEFACDPKIL